MCAGIPAIVSSTSIDRYYFKDSVVMFFSSNDDEDLARCILLLAGDETLRSEMVCNGSDFVRTMTWDRHKSRYFELVDSLVGSPEIGPARMGTKMALRPSKLSSRQVRPRKAEQFHIE